MYIDKKTKTKSELHYGVVIASLVLPHQAVDILQRLDDRSNAVEQVAATREKKKGLLSTLSKVFG